MPYIQLLRHREKAENLKCRTLKKNAGTIGTVKNYQNSDRQNDVKLSAGEEPFSCPLFLT